MNYPEIIHSKNNSLGHLFAFFGAISCTGSDVY
jgi:hypothetical protein